MGAQCRYWVHRGDTPRIPNGAAHQSLAKAKGWPGPNRNGVCRAKSDALQAALAGRGNRGVMMLISAVMEMLAALLLDLKSVLTSHVLTKVHQRKKSAAEEAARNSHEDGRSVVWRGRWGCNDASAQGRGPNRTHTRGRSPGDSPAGLQPYPPGAHARIMQHPQVMAVRNGKSKVSAVRKVSELLTKKISNLYGEQQVKSKGYAEAIWKQLQSSALKWARKKSRVELLQVSSVTGQVHESDEAVYAQHSNLDLPLLSTHKMMWQQTLWPGQM